MTISLQLDAPRLSAFLKEAEELGVTPEQLALDIVHKHIRSRTASASGVADPAFASALAASISENEELLRRLAK